MFDVSRVRALLVKDLREALPNKGVVVPTLLLPVVVCVLMPLLSIVGGAAGQSVMKLDPAAAEKLFALYDIPAMLTNVQDKTLHVFLNHTFVPLFLILPIMASTIFATHGVVGEKEHRTLETLLQTPIRASEFVAAKILGALVPAIVLAFVSFALFVGTTLAGGAVFARPVLLDFSMWVPVVLLLSPAMSLAGLSVALVVSLRAKTFVEAQQITGMAVVPLVVVMVGATTGRVAVNPSGVVVSGLVIVVVAVLFLARLAPRLDRERLIQTV